ncbi:MAG TPA: hypothetical protein PKZ99_04715, partial [Azospirillaceae bacterium]|nr:hypothetical protein [Azospirillaceae bacterium]
MSRQFHDVRGEGFSHRARVADASAWIMAAASATLGEYVPLVEAAGRCLVRPLTVAPAPSSRPLARRNGVAVRAERTFGASSYDPVRLPTSEAQPFQTGEPLPPGFDAVAPYGAARVHDGVVELLAAVAPGENIQRAPSQPVEIAGGRPLAPPLLALLAAGGLERVEVFRRPRVRL